MQNGKIVIIEDAPLLRSYFCDVVSAAGHEIVAQADNLPDAETIVDRIASGVMEADVIVLDGRFPNASDGEIVANRLREQNVGAWVIGWSTSWLEGVDIDLGKQCEPDDMLQALADLPKPGRFRNGESTVI